VGALRSSKNPNGVAAQERYHRDKVGELVGKKEKKNTNEYVDITRVVVYPSGCAGQSECARTLLNRCVGLGAYL
jgi:hypothetical protein